MFPFWCFSAEAQVVVHSAEVGKDYWASQYNPATRRTEMTLRTSWTRVYLDWRYVRRWGAEDPETQEYGGAKYRHDPALDRMRPLGHVRAALSYGDYVGRAGAGAAAPERLHPFRLGPLQAEAAVLKRVRAAEARNVEKQLLSLYSADRVQLVALDVGLRRRTAMPVFVPVWVFKTRVRRTAMRTLVAGFAGGLTAGPVLPNPGRVATVVAAAAPCLLLLAGLVSGWQQALWLGALLPGAASYAAASFWPELHARYLGLRAAVGGRLRPAPGTAADEAEWARYEWVRPDADDSYSYDEGGGYRGHGRREQGSTSSSSSSSSDPRGYYRTLGVSPGASTAEVQAAFRAAALKWHPDRHPDPARKSEATRRFQAVQEAYGVLRDPGRRARYGAGGGA